MSNRPLLSLWKGLPATPALTTAEALMAEHKEMGTDTVSKRRLEVAVTRAQRVQLVRLLPVLREDLQASYSHSHEGRNEQSRCAAATAVAGGPIGVDLEWTTRPRPRLQALAARMFAPAEVAFLASVEEKEELWAKFLQIWTLREAMCKAMKMTMAEGRRRFSLRADKGGGWQLWLDGQRQSGWCWQHWRPLPELLLTLVWYSRERYRPALFVADKNFELQSAIWPPAYH